MAKDPKLTQSSTRTTGGDPIEGVDPGGTHSTKPGQADKSEPKQAKPKTDQTVQSSDLNSERESQSAQPKGLDN